MLRAIGHFFIKDWKVSWRNPLFLAICVALPLVFVSLYAMVIQVSATNPVVIARESHGEYSDGLMRVLRSIKSVDGPYFHIETEDPAEAFERYEAGAAAAVIHIPEDFDRTLKAGELSTVNLHVVNINSDGTKNVQLRLEHALYVYNQTYNLGQSIAYQEYSAFQEDISIKHYLGSALLMFTVLYAAMVITGTLIAREWEEKTVKPLLLSPRGFVPFIGGKWLSALAQTAVITMTVLLLSRLILGYPVEQVGISAVVAVAAFFVYGAAVGTLFGVTLQKSLIVVPVSAITAIAHFLLCGYESYIRGFAHSGALEWAWQLASWHPISGLTDQIRFSMQGVGLHWNETALGWMIILVTVLTVWAVYHMKRKLTFAQGQ